LNTYVAYYKEAVNPNVVPVLLIIYNQEIGNKNDIEKFKNRIDLEKKDIPNLERLKIEFIEEDNIGSFDVLSILKN